MKRLLLLFVPLMFFFGCEKDNPDAISQSNNNGLEDNTCTYSYFNINGSANHDGEYSLSFVPNLMPSENMFANDKHGDLLYVYSGNSVLFDQTYLDKEGWNGWILNFLFLQYGDSAPQLVSGTYSPPPLGSPVESVLDNPSIMICNVQFWDNGDYSYIETVDGVISVIQEDQNYIITFDLVAEDGVEITGCYSGEINAL